MKATEHFRNLSILFTITAALVLGIGITSCSNDDEKSSNSSYYERITGSWEAYHQTGYNSNGEEWDEDMNIYSETIFLTFRTNGKGYVTSYLRGNVDYTEDFEYCIKGRNIVMNFKDITEVLEIQVLTPYNMVLKSLTIDAEGKEVNTISFKATLND